VQNCADGLYDFTVVLAIERAQPNVEQQVELQQQQKPKHKQALSTAVPASVCNVCITSIAAATREAMMQFQQQQQQQQQQNKQNTAAAEMKQVLSAKVLQILKHNRDVQNGIEYIKQVMIENMPQFENPPIHRLHEEDNDSESARETYEAFANAGNNNNNSSYCLVM